jgi:hypothetical protein
MKHTPHVNRYGMSFVEIISAVTRGERPELNRNCIHDSNVQGAAAFATLMKQCLAAEPTERPSFVRIISQLIEQSCSFSNR